MSKNDEIPWWLLLLGGVGAALVIAGVAAAAGGAGKPKTYSCGNCGGDIKEGAPQCPHCGVKLVWG